MDVAAALDPVPDRDAQVLRPRPSRSGAFWVDHGGQFLLLRTLRGSVSCRYTSRVVYGPPRVRKD